MIITKELLEAVFSIKINTDITIENAFDDVNGIELEWKEVNFNFIYYPLDFVVHKCKEWALTHNNDIDDNGYYIFNYSYKADDYETKIIKFTVYTTKLNRVSVGSSYHGLNIFTAETEPEAIFKACQWILDNKKDVI